MSRGGGFRGGRPNFDDRMGRHFDDFHDRGPHFFEPRGGGGGGGFYGGGGGRGGGPMHRNGLMGPGPGKMENFWFLFFFSAPLFVFFRDGGFLFIISIYRRHHRHLLLMILLPFSLRL